MLGCVCLRVCRSFGHICKVSDSFLALSLFSLLPWFRVSHWPGSWPASIRQPTLRVWLFLPCNTGVQMCLPWLFNMNAGDLNLGTYTYKSKCSYPLSHLTIHPNVVVDAVVFISFIYCLLWLLSRNTMLSKTTFLLAPESRLDFLPCRNGECGLVISASFETKQSYF